MVGQAFLRALCLVEGSTKAKCGVSGHGSFSSNCGEKSNDKKGCIFLTSD